MVLAIAISALNLASQETPAQTDAAHLEKNPTFLDWADNCPKDWKRREVNLRLTGENLSGKPVIEMTAETGHGVFYQILTDSAKMLRYGDTLGAEFFVRNTEEKTAELYIGIESDVTGKPEVTIYSQFVPTSQEWKAVRISWPVEKALLGKNGQVLRIVYGIRFKAPSAPKPIEICAPSIWFSNSGL